MRAKYRKGMVFTILAGVVALVVFAPERNPPSAPSVSRASPLAQPEARAAAPGSKGESLSALLVLPERPALSEPPGALFGPQSWQPPPPPKVAASPPPSAPPLPYRFAGRVVHGGKLQVFLSKGDAAIPISEGLTLDGTYRVESIATDRITLIYLPLNKRESIPAAAAARTAETTAPAIAAVPNAAAPATIASAPSGASRVAIGTVPTRSVVGSAPVPSMQQRKSTETGAAELNAPSKPARLLWDGPAQVKLGAQFSVALRLNSDQPVHASPMQVRFDPTLLETVAVKPGRFFEQGDRNFNYRVNPDGSIFIGASNQGLAPASDAELLVLTFRPIKPASLTELSITSLNLQGTGGRTIAFDSLSAFKTAIIP